MSATSSVDCLSLLYMVSMSSEGSDNASKRLRTSTVKVSFISTFDVTSFQTIPFMGLCVGCFEVLGSSMYSEIGAYCENEK